MRKLRCPCGLRRTRKGHDRCIANLPKVQYACCGHFDMRYKSGRIAIPHLVFIIHPSLPSECIKKVKIFNHKWGPGNDFTALFGRDAAYAFDELQLFHGSKK